MKPRRISVSVPDRCAQDWTKFEKTEGGRLCQLCSHVVVDFTKMNDRELGLYLAGKQGRVCGRIGSHQLKVYELESAVHIQPGFGLLKASLLSILLTILHPPASANLPDRPAIEARDSSETEGQPDPRNVLLGVVREKEGNEPLPGVNIIVKGTTNGTVSDADGRFKIEVFDPGTVLVVSFIGFASIEYTVKSENESNIELFLEPDTAALTEIIITGQLNVEGVYETRTLSLWEKIKRIF